METICEIEVDYDTVILTPSYDLGEFEFDRLVDDVNAVMQLLDGSMKNVLIDFHKSDYFGSNAVNLFLALRRRTMQIGGRMAIFAVSDQEKEILKVMSLDQLFPICSSREEALKTVRVPS